MNQRINLSKERLEQKIESLELAIRTTTDKPTIKYLERQAYIYTNLYLSLTNRLNNSY